MSSDSAHTTSWGKLFLFFSGSFSPGCTARFSDEEPLFDEAVEGVSDFFLKIVGILSWWSLCMCEKTI